MTMRKKTPEHDFWHKRVEGQIRHTIGRHPEWFNFEEPYEKSNCVNSLAKRIVGEILAVAKMAEMTKKASQKCHSSSALDDVGRMSLGSGAVGEAFTAPDKPTRRQKMIDEAVAGSISIYAMSVIHRYQKTSSDLEREFAIPFRWIRQEFHRLMNVNHKSHQH